MNGATAEPWLSTISAPSSAITSRIGSSQNFLRALRKAQSSLRNDMGKCLKLVGQGLGRRARRVALDPVALRLGIALEPQRVLARQAHGDAERRDHPVVENADHDRAHDL